MKSVQQLQQELNLLESTLPTLSILDKDDFTNKRMNILRQISEQEKSDGIDETVEWLSRVEYEISMQDCQDFI